MNLVTTDPNGLKLGKVIGGMFITGECPTKEIFEVNMYPIFTDSEGKKRVLMQSMLKKKFVTSDIHVMNQKIDEIISITEGQDIRGYIDVTRVSNSKFGTVEICVCKDILSHQVMYNGASYMYISDEIERPGYSVCYFANRKAPKYIEIKELVYLTGSLNLCIIYFFYRIIKLKSKLF